MATRPDVKTQSVTRQKLAAFLPNHELVKHIEAISNDVSGVLPDATQTAQATANTAIVNAATAQATADAATITANAAKAEADALAVVPFVTIGTSSTTTSERALAVGSGLTLVDGGAGASVTLDLKTPTLAAILPADVSESAAAFTDATGLLIALAANSTYLVDGLITFQSAAITTGIGLAFTLPAGATISGLYHHNSTATALVGSYNNASGATKGDTSAVPTAADNVPITGRWLIKTAGTAGNAQLRFRTSLATSAITLKQDLSALTARKLA